MTILELCDFGGPYGGSFVPMVAALAKEATRRGYATTAVFPPRAADRAWVKQLEPHVQRLVIAPSRSRRDLGRLFERLAADASPPVVLHSHFSGFDVPATLAALGHGDRHVIWHVHGNIRGGLAVTARNCIRFGILGRLTDRIICVGPNVKDDLRKRLAPSSRLVVLPNAIDLDRFRPPPQGRREELRRRYGFRSDDFVALHFGWDWWVKGGDLFVEAGAMLRDRTTNIIFASVRAPESAPGIVPLPTAADATDLYGAVDVFVSASRVEGMPFSVVEALATGIPVVATDIPGHTAIGKLPNLHFVERENPQALAESILQLTERSEDEASRLADEARRRLAGHLGLDQWASAAVDLCDEVARRH